MRTLEQQNAEIEALKAFALGGAYVDPSPNAPPVVVPPSPAEGLYAEIGGIPAGLSIFHEGDLSKLGGPAILRPDGRYTISGALRQNLYAAERSKLKIAVPFKQQVKVAKGVTLAGFGITGGGLAKSTNGKEAAVVTDDGVCLCDFEVQKTLGVGILMSGTGLRSRRLYAHDCGTSGRMVMSRGKNNKLGTGFHEVDTVLRGNNHGGISSDAANKATQTSEWLSENLMINDEEDGGQWLDISCWHCVFKKPSVTNIFTRTGDLFKACGFRFELMCHGRYASGVWGGHIANVAGTAMACNESSNLVFDGMTIGPCQYTWEGRQLTRKDDPGDGGEVGPWPLGPDKPENRRGPGRPGGNKLAWELYGVSLINSTLLDGAGPIVLSGAGSGSKDLAPRTKDVRQKANRLTFSNLAGKVDVRVK